MTRSLLILAALPALFAAVIAPGGELRTWTDGDGRTVEAAYVSREADTVTIRRSDGRIFTFPLERLSPRDRDYVRNRESAGFPVINVHRPPAEDFVDRVLAYGELEGWDTAAGKMRDRLTDAYGGGGSHLHDWYGLYRWIDIFQDTPFHRDLRGGEAPFGDTWPDSLRRFALTHHDFSTEFFQLVSRHDRLDEVSRILETLYRNAPRSFRNYPSLALAIAVVYDEQPPANWPHRQVSRELLPRRLPEPEEAFEFFVDSHRAGRLLINPQRLRAEELRFTVDIVAPIEDLKWAQQNVRQGLSRFDHVYYAVDYDNSRFSRTVETIQYQWPHADYRLGTILEKGGICVDQAYFASQAGKARGLPTLYFTGTGNDAGHAWFGYMRGTTGGWNLDVGRYFMRDNYVTGYALDPQTWKPIRDHDISYVQERFHRSQTYRDSIFHSDFAREFYLEDNPEKARSAARRALDIESRNRDAWNLVLEMDFAGGDVDAYENTLREAAGAFSRYPDIEAHYTGLLAASLLDRGDRETAYREMRRISRKNRRERPDISLSQAALFLRYSLENDRIDTSIDTFRGLLSELGNHAPGMGFHREVALPFFVHLAGEGHLEEARRLVRETRRTLDPDGGTPLDRELAEIAGKLR